MTQYIDRERARELIEVEGKTIIETARILGCGRRQLTNLKRDGWPEMKRYQKVDPVRVAYLTRMQWSTKRIADELRCSTRQVTRARVKAEVAQAAHPRSGKPADPEMLKIAAELVEQEASIGEIHRTTGLHRDTIRRHFPNAGQNEREWMELWGQIRNDTKMRRLFDEMGGIT